MENPKQYYAGFNITSDTEISEEYWEEVLNNLEVDYNIKITNRKFWECTKLSHAITKIFK